MNERTTKSYCSLTAHVFTITDFFRFVNESNRHGCSCKHKQQQRVVNNRFTRYFFTFVRLFLPVDRLGNRDDDIKWGKVNWSADKFFSINFQSQSHMESYAARYTVCHTNVSKFNFHWQLMGFSIAAAIDLIDHLWAIWPYSHSMPFLPRLTAHSTSNIAPFDIFVLINSSLGGLLRFVAFLDRL